MILKTIKKAIKNTSLYERHSKNKQLKSLYKKNLILQKEGDAVLRKLFDIIVEKNHKKLWLEYGTLLGAYREKNYIRHDFDIDLGMYVEDFTEEIVMQLESEGMFIKRTFFLEDLQERTRTMTEVTIQCGNLPVDIFFNFRENYKRSDFVYIMQSNQHARIQQFAVKKWTVDDTDIQPFNFKGMTLYAPQKTEDYLKAIYGETFMTPIVYYNGEPKVENPHVSFLSFERYRGIMLGRWD